MQVFKLYFKLIKNTSTPIILITAFFIIYLFLFMEKGNYDAVVKQDKVNLAVIINNKEDDLWDQLNAILKNYSQIYIYSDEEELLEDKLSILNIDGIITIPHGFEQDLLTGKEIILKYQKISDNSKLSYITDICNHYISSVSMFVEKNGKPTSEEVIEFINTTLETTGEYIEIGHKDTLNNYGLFEKYYRLASFIVFMVCLIGTGMALHSFQNIHIQRRNRLSPVADGFRNLQMFLGNLIIVFLYDIFLILVSIIYVAPSEIDIYLFFYWMNLCVFSTSALSISFLMAMLTKKREINILLAILLPLALSFISGIFSSPQELGEGILKIAYYTPTYWFVKGNDIIMNSGYGRANLFEFLPCVLTQILFGAAFFCIALLLGKEKRNKL